MKDIDYKFHQLVMDYIRRTGCKQTGLADELGVPAQRVSEFMKQGKTASKYYVLLCIQCGIFTAAELMDETHKWWKAAERAERIYSADQLAKKGIDVREINSAINCGGE
jgi:hypothetical protein